MRTLMTFVLNDGQQFVDAGLRVKRLKEPSSSAELVLVCNNYFDYIIFFNEIKRVGMMYRFSSY